MIIVAKGILVILVIALGVLSASDDDCTMAYVSYLLAVMVGMSLILV